MKAMILAAGYGTRLGILSEQRPKPMLPVGNIPLIVHALELLKRAQIFDVCINTHHKGDLLTTFLGDGQNFGVTIHWSHEEGEILGTGGGVKKVRDFFGRDPAVILNGKIVTTCDLGEVIDFHKERGALGTMVLKPDPDAGRWGSIGADQAGRLVSILGKDAQNNETPSASTMFTGISVIEPGFLDFLPEGPSCMVRQGWKPLFAAGEALFGYTMPANGYWWEHSTPARYLQGNKNLFEQDLLSRLGITFHNDPCDSISLADNTSVLLGKNITVGKGVVFSGMVVAGEGVSIAPGVTLEDCVIWPRSAVTQSLFHSIVTPRGILEVPRQNSQGGFTGPALR
ncbi:NDP-sugar synthase [Myxococcota bacterium]|nr:NDP-sugar synthase [Myxococcota bacterium]MBU1536544.1 NDP-sugar synthase [Myxococcota bacterium]